jgi:hypothetical protein
VLTASLWIVGSGLVVGGVLEPAWEYWVDGAEYEWAFGAARSLGALKFAGAGLVTYVLVLALGGRKKTGA